MSLYDDNTEGDEIDLSSLDGFTVADVPDEWAGEPVPADAVIGYDEDGNAYAQTDQGWLPVETDDSDEIDFTAAEQHADEVHANREDVEEAAFTAELDELMHEHGITAEELPELLEHAAANDYDLANGAVAFTRGRQIMADEADHPSSRRSRDPMAAALDDAFAPGGEMYRGARASGRARKDDALGREVDKFGDEKQAEAALRKLARQRLAQQRR